MNVLKTKSVLLFATVSLSILGIVTVRAQSVPPLGNHRQNVLSAVPMIRILANPEAFDGKQVQFIGYVVKGFENNAVYPHKEDYVHAINNGIWLRSSTGAPNNREIDQVLRMV